MSQSAVRRTLFKGWPVAITHTYYLHRLTLPKYLEYRKSAMKAENEEGLKAIIIISILLPLGPRILLKYKTFPLNFMNNNEQHIAHFIKPYRDTVHL